MMCIKDSEKKNGTAVFIFDSTNLDLHLYRALTSEWKNYCCQISVAKS